MFACRTLPICWTVTEFSGIFAVSYRHHLLMKPHMSTASSKRLFPRIASKAARACGQPGAFAIAVSVILIWALTGPIFKFSDTWQLIINTGTTVVTFLMVFLIQSTQNRESEAVQLKLDELIRAVKGAQNAMLDLEELDEEEMDIIRADYQKLAEKARSQIQRKSALPKEPRKESEINTEPPPHAP